MAQPTVVGLVQQKGGVGKSTTTINLAGASAARGNNVAVMDGDPQGFLTNKLGFREHYKTDEGPLTEAILEPTDADIAEIAQPHPEFDVIPGSADMFSVEQDLIASSWRPRERLHMLLDSDERAQRGLDPLPYDFIFIDAPPYMGVLSDNVLRATDELIIPVETDDIMEVSIELLLSQVSTVENRYSTTISENSFVISNVVHPLDNSDREMIHYFGRLFRDRWPVHAIRNRKSIKEAVSNGGSVFAEEAQHCDQAEVYDHIAASLEVNS